MNKIKNIILLTILSLCLCSSVSFAQQVGSIWGEEDDIVYHWSEKLLRFMINQQHLVKNQSVSSSLTAETYSSALLGEPIAFSTTYDVADYFPIVNTDTWTYLGDNAMTVTVNGTRVITVVSGTYTTIRFQESLNNVERYHTLDGSGLKDYGNTTKDGRDFLLQSPLMVMPKNVAVGAYTTSAVGNVDGSSSDFAISFNITINEPEDVIVNGITFKNAMKITIVQTTVETPGGATTIINITKWYFKYLGEIKSVDEKLGEGQKTTYIQSGVTHYASGRKKAELLSAVDSSGFIYYEYNDETLNRASRKQRIDGSYILVKSYWGATTTSMREEEYSSSGNLVEVRTYASNGQLQNKLEYYLYLVSSSSHSILNLKLLQHYQYCQHIASAYQKNQ